MFAALAICVGMLPVVLALYTIAAELAGIRRALRGEPDPVPVPKPPKRPRIPRRCAGCSHDNRCRAPGQGTAECIAELRKKVGV